jgi:hypothetical protein
MGQPREGGGAAGDPGLGGAASDTDEQDQVPGEVGEGEGRQPDRRVAGEQDRGQEGGEQADNCAADDKNPAQGPPSASAIIAAVVNDMARTTIEITQEALVALGVERLATMLMEHAVRDGSLARKLKLALAASAGEDSLAKALAQRIRALARDDRFIEWNEASSFAHEIDQIRAAIVDDLAPRAPPMAADLLADLVHTSDAVFERADDSSGAIGDVYREAVEDWGRVWCRISERQPDTLAATVLHEFRNDDYGIKDGIIAAFADALGERGLKALHGLLQAEIEQLSVSQPHAKGGWDHERAVLTRGLAEVADARHDVDAYVEAVSREAFPERQASEVARRMLAAGRPGEALDWLDRAGSGRHEPGHPGEIDLRIAALEALGRDAEAQTARWDWFKKTLSFDHFRDYLERIPAAERRHWTDRAIATAEERHQDIASALRFLTRIDETEAAERLVLARAEEIDGHLYFVLRPVAEALAPAHPLGAVILYRAMTLAVLGAARSKFYRYAARDLLSAGQAAERVTDWHGLPDHAAFLRRLRQEHGRKHSFWPLLE